jgi:hypothetical protein
MLKTGEADLAAIPQVTSWRDLLPQVEAYYSQTFSDRNEGGDLVLLTPAKWGDGLYDEVQQRAVRVVVDTDGRPLPLILPYTAESADGVSALQHAASDTLTSVLGLLRLGKEGLFVEPITLYRREGRVDVTLDRPVLTRAAVPAAAAGPTSTDAVEDEVAEAEEQDDAAPASVSPIGQMLTGILRELEKLAESGISSCPDVGMISRYAKECDAIGLNICVSPLMQLATAWESFRKSTERNAAPAADALLRSYFIMHTAANLESIGWATQHLR